MAGTQLGHSISGAPPHADAIRLLSLMTSATRGRNSDISPNDPREGGTQLRYFFRPFPQAGRNSDTPASEISHLYNMYIVHTTYILITYSFNQSYHERMYYASNPFEEGGQATRNVNHYNFVNKSAGRAIFNRYTYKLFYASRV